MWHHSADMNDARRPPATHNHPAAITVVAIIGTVVVLIGGLTLAALAQLRALQNRPIEQVPTTDLTLAIVAGVFFLIALGWALWLRTRYGTRSLRTIIAAAISLVLLVATPVFAWAAFDGGRDLTIATMTCTASAQAASANDPLAGCESTAVDTIVLLQGVNSDSQWTPAAASTNETRAFTDLPAVSWKANLVVDGPESTVTAYALAERDGGWHRIGRLQPALDAASGRLRWSATIAVDANVRNLRVQFVLSEHEAVGSAQLRFVVYACSGQSPRTFAAEDCDAIDIDTALIREATPEGNRTWRQPVVTYDGGTMVVGNLEARTYTFQPDYTAIQVRTQATDILIIPAAMPQQEANSLALPGASSFPIDITSSSGVLEYNIYIFPAGAEFATRS